MAVTLLMNVGMWAQTRADATASAESLRDQADSLYGIQQYDEAKTLALKGLRRLNDGQVSESDDETKGDLLNLLSIIHVRQGHFEEAAEYARQCN